MDLNINGKNAIVTGATYGLGFACAKVLAGEGANVSICSRGEDKVADAVREISNDSGTAKCIATEYAADGITANVICPGYFDTPLVQGLAQQYADSQKVSRETVLQDWADYSPMKKFGKPDDLGALVSFLASPRAEFITGTTITIDGGAVRQW